MNLTTHPQGYTFEYGDVLCAICYGPTGGINGYVRCPPDHPQHGMQYDDLDVEVHGGLTFSGLPRWLNRPKDEWWFGFDTSHCFDWFPMREDPAFINPRSCKLSPDMEKFLDAMDDLIESLKEATDLEDWELPVIPVEHRSEAYVLLECQNLAKQLLTVGTLPTFSKEFLTQQIQNLLYSVATKE